MTAGKSMKPMGVNAAANGKDSKISSQATRGNKPLANISLRMAVKDPGMVTDHKMRK